MSQFSLSHAIMAPNDTRWQTQYLGSFGSTGAASFALGAPPVLGLHPASSGAARRRRLDPRRRRLRRLALEQRLVEGSQIAIEPGDVRVDEVVRSLRERHLLVRERERVGARVADLALVGGRRGGAAGGRVARRPGSLARRIALARTRRLEPLLNLPLDAVDDGGGLGVQIAYASQVRDQRRGESCAGRARDTGDGERVVERRGRGGVNPGGKGAETAGERGSSVVPVVSFSAVDTTPND